MARGGGTGSRGNKKKKADGPGALSQQNGVGGDSRNGPDAAGDKHKTTQKHNRRQKVGL